MKQFLTFSFLIFFATLTFSNYGAYYASGNHLIPISETDISVKKEILTLKKIRNQYIEVTVYYEFFNPKEEKAITVGFEAFSPYGDADGRPKNLQHPYIGDFTVNLNNQILSYKTAYVTDSNYIKNGHAVSADINKLIPNDDSYVSDAHFYYVYHFDAKFKKGKNIIKHTYNYNISNGIEYNYDFKYILTAANRWGNKQIDDFTLNIDMGEFEQFSIDKAFFKDSSDWLINGIGKTAKGKPGENRYNEKDALKFFIQKGNIIFQKLNFKPKGELFLYPLNYVTNDSFDIESYLPFSYYQHFIINPPKDGLSQKIPKNLSFARRGYIFTNPEIQNYYTKMDWYIPNPNYIPNIDMMEEVEKKWVERWK